MSPPAVPSCRIFPITVVGPECSGHGSCGFYPSTNLSVCTCEPGWHGGSDFQVTTSLTDCQTPTVLIYVLWAICLFAIFAIGITYIPKLRELKSKHLEKVEAARAKGKKYTLFDNKPLLSLIPYFGLGFPCMIAFAIAKLANVETYLGESVLLSVLYIIWRLTFYFAFNMFQANFLRALLRNEKSLQVTVQVNMYVNLIMFISMTLLCLAIILPLADPEFGMISAAVFLLGASISMLTIAIISIVIKRHVNDVLDKSFAMTRDSKTSQLKARFSKLQSKNINTTVIQFIIYLVYGAFPYMWNKHEFLVPIVWIPVLLAMGSVLDSLLENNQAESSTANNTSNLGARDRGESNLVVGGMFSGNKKGSVLDSAFDPTLSNVKE